MKMKKVFSLILVLSMIGAMLVPLEVQAAAYDETTYRLTGNQIEDIIGIAKTQVGYAEGNNYSQLDGTVAGSGNYTKYASDLAAAGYWASNPNQWCAYFVSWCAMKAGCLDSAIPYSSVVKLYPSVSKPYKTNAKSTFHAVRSYTWTKGDYFSYDYIFPVEDYKPKKGDLVIYEGHVGLVSGDYNWATGTFEMIDGNSSNNKVQRRNITVGNIVGFFSPVYNVTEPPAETHYHSWTEKYEAAHPHRNYRECGCKRVEYTGSTSLVSSCAECYPIGNVTLSHSYDKTTGKVTFSRNNVSNAHFYYVNVYKSNGDLYNTYNMPDRKLTLTNMPVGDYTAELIAVNQYTGMEKISKPRVSFRFVNTYKIYYNANGGSGAPASAIKNQDELFQISSVVPKKTGHIFKGWATSKNALSPQYQPGNFYIKNVETTFYAVWEPEKYTINYDANGGKGDLESVTITYGDTIRMPNSIIQDNYYLKGWAKSKNASTPDFVLGKDYKITENCTLYAVWGNSTWSGAVASSFAGGDGTKENPYQISNAGELAYLAKNVNSATTTPEYKYYELTDNINLAYMEWVPVGIYGNSNQYFYGSFDGNGYTISDLYITNLNEGYVGLIGYTKDSEIKNLNVSGAIENITSTTAAYVGAVTGYAGNTNVENCSVMYFNIANITVSSTSYVGGIIGRHVNGNIKKCLTLESHIDLKSGNFVTGMIAGHSNGNISDCEVKSTESGLFSTASSVGTFNMGGLCGGFSGKAERCNVKAPYLSNNLKTNNTSYIGGLLGYLDGEATVCSVVFTDGKSKTIDGESYQSSIYSSGTGTISAGGIAGRVDGDANIADCKYDGQSVAVTADTSCVGGLLAFAQMKSNTSVSVRGGESLDTGMLPMQNGYRVKWYTNADFTTEYDFSKNVTANQTIYAKWEKSNTPYDIWDGTSKEPALSGSTYTITSGEELAWVSDVTNGIITSGTNFPSNTTFKGYTVKLANDIYLNDISGWKDWSYSNPPANSWKTIKSFAGTLNGNNHAIYGQYSNTLISELTGILKNLTVHKSQIGSSVFVRDNYGDMMYCGSTAYAIFGLVLTNQSDGYIGNCFNNGECSGGSYYAGGIAGTNYGDVVCCYNSAPIMNHQYTGGIVGRNKGSDATINMCYNSAKIDGLWGGGGIAALNQDGATIVRSYNTGTISGTLSYNGGICAKNNTGLITQCYNCGTIRTDGEFGYGGIVGTNEGTADMYGRITYCYSKNTAPIHTNVNSYITVTGVSALSASNLKVLSNLSGFSTYVWGVSSSYNSGYPYLKDLENTYKSYTISTVAYTDNPSIKRSFANVDGILYSEATSSSYAGGAIGKGNNNSGLSKPSNLMVIADRISSVSNGSSSTAYAGSLIAFNPSGNLKFTNAYYGSEVDISAVNTANATKVAIDNTGTSRAEKTINVTFLTNTLGLNQYKSIADIENDETAVWVLKNGQLPELYYNCLNHIIISDDITNGVVTVDKEQAVDGEVVTITATPAENYVLNKIYVNGEEIVGNTFEVSGEANVYATFSEKIAEYNVTISGNENVSASLTNVDETSEASLMSMATNMTANLTGIKAKDGEEIRVDTIVNEDYTIDSIYVNGKEIVGDSFILTADTEVTMDVRSISTDIPAVTNDVEQVGCYYAIISGSVEQKGDSFYVRYWTEDDTEAVYTSAVLDSDGSVCTVELTDLMPDTTYYYQITENGEVKSFTTVVNNETDPEFDGVIEGEEIVDCITFTTYSILTSSSKYKFSIECSEELVTEYIAVALYDENGNMLSMDYTECDGDTEYDIKLPVDKRAVYAKVFTWDSLSGMKPRASAETVELN